MVPGRGDSSFEPPVQAVRGWLEEVEEEEEAGLAMWKREA